MRWLDKILMRLRSLLGRDRMERELESEFRFHLDQQIAENLQAGMSPKEARAAALRAVGGIAQLEEECRDARGVQWFETLAQDLRYAFRTLRRTPAFTVVAVLTLALGIGANTAIFSLVDAVMLKLLPVREPQRLFFLRSSSVQVGNFHISRTVSLGTLKQMAQAKTLDGITAYDEAPHLNVSVNGRVDLASGNFVSGTYFNVLGVPAVLGRTLTPDDDRPEAAAAQGWPAMVSYGYWQLRFAGRADVLGQRVTINQIPFVIVGVIAPGFTGIDLEEHADLVMPSVSRSQVIEEKVSAGFPKPDDYAGQVVGRLRPGMSLSTAAAELTVIFRQNEIALAGAKMSNDQREAIQKLSIEPTPAGQGSSAIRKKFSTALEVLMVVVGLVMLIACANIASLLLARSSARQREIAVRLSLGSSRMRLARQLLTESLVLSALGGTLGLLLAIWGRNAIVYFATSEAGSIPLQLDWRLLAFTAGVCILNALLFGLAPAWRASRIDCNEALKSRSGRTASRLPMGRVLVAGQVAISLALLVGAALFLSTLRRLYQVDLGYSRDQLLMMTVDPHLAGYEGTRLPQFWNELTARAKATPGVRSVSLMSNRLLGGMTRLNSLFVPGYTPSPAEKGTLWVVSFAVGPQFFATTGMPLVAGRDFTELDSGTTSPRVAVINQSMAKHFFGDRDAIGQHIGNDSKGPMAEIVGIAKDVHYFGMTEDKQDVWFSPMMQDAGVLWYNPLEDSTLVVRTNLDPDRMVSDLRGVVRAIDPNVPVYDVKSMSEQVDANLAQQRTLALLTSFFGLLALGLSAIGLYGVLAYGVAQRTGEIGIRMALGADRSSILRLIFRETVQVLAIGIAAGLAIAIGGGKLVQSLLFGVTPHDIGAFAAGVLVLSAVALIAAL